MRFALSLAAAAGVVAFAVPSFQAQAMNVSSARVTRDIHHDVSQPLRDMARFAPAIAPHPPRIVPEHELPHLRQGPRQKDPVLQTEAGAPVGTTNGLNFAGVGNGDYGYTPNSAPPDTNGAVGATQYVQIVNESFAVFNKSTGALVMGPVVTNSVWSGFGGGCQNNDDGDAVVAYDKIAGRWIISQFSVSTKPYLQCIAVSTTSDATGTYNRYAFSYSLFPDYPKIGVWPDGYYTTYNMFKGNSFDGSALCALNRSAMLTGAAATQQCFQLAVKFSGVLPADLDGATQPPAGAPNYMMNFDTNSLNLWRFHVDWTTPANTTLSGPVNIPVAAFSEACNGGVCVPQGGTKNTLDSLGDRLMHRLAYRNFSTYESLVVNHSVVAGSSVGVRWYEVRSPGSNPAVYQSGTFAPDSTWRWMGSIAEDKAGDIAVGYSASSASIFPAIRYTGRVPTDPPGTLEGEQSVQAGSGSQAKGLNRWGDYSAVTLDPTDDCTFFYTNEYLKTNGTFNWSTRINSFKFPGCQ